MKALMKDRETEKREAEEAERRPRRPKKKWRPTFEWARERDNGFLDFLISNARYFGG